MAKLANLTLVIYFRLMRMLKIMRKQKKIEQYMKERLKMSSSVERLIYFAAIFFLLCHITACLFYLIAKLEDFGPKTWVVRLGFLDDFHPDVIFIKINKVGLYSSIILDNSNDYNSRIR